MYPFLRFVVFFLLGALLMYLVLVGWPVIMSLALHWLR